LPAKHPAAELDFSNLGSIGADMNRFLRLTVVFCLFLLSTNVPLSAGWVPDGTPVYTGLDMAGDMRVVPDGAGGAFVTWWHARPPASLRGQHIDQSGNLQWPEDGLALCDSCLPSFMKVIPDGLGGVIITWKQSTNTVEDPGDIHAQRIDSAGDRLWGSNGIVVCDADGWQYKSWLASDGDGGAFIVWGDWPDWSDHATQDLYAQRVSANGIRLWPERGLPVSTAPGSQGYPSVVPDGNGGVIVAWSDRRAAQNTSDLYAQKLDADGVPQWTVDGVYAGGRPGLNAAIADGSGGVIVAWADWRGDDVDIYAQRFSTDGTVLWEDDGVPVCTGLRDQHATTVVPDGLGGAIIGWENRRGSISQYNFQAQRVDANGNVLWDGCGIDVPSAGLDRRAHNPHMSSDGEGGVVVTWDEYTGEPDDIFAQRLNGSGEFQWDSTGVVVCSAQFEQQEPIIVPSVAGRSIIVWLDGRVHYIPVHIYAQSLDNSGRIDFPTPVALESFETRVEQGAAVLVWRTSIETGVPGFHVLRSRTERGIYSRVTRVFIPAAGGLAGGATYYYRDDSVEAGHSYFYKLEEVGEAGNGNVYGPWMLQVPAVNFLAQNVPNPFNPATEIRFSLATDEHARLTIYDATGRLIRTLVDRHMAAGANTARWDGRDESGGAVSSGVYFYRLKTAAIDQTRKMVVLR